MAVAKKKKAKKPAQPGIDPNEKRRERLEAKRAAKAAALAEKQKRENRERWIRRIALLGLFLAAVWFLFLRNAVPNEIDGYPINEFSTAGANQHTAGPVAYEDSPPVSGQHAGSPGPCGVHDEAMPDETMVHNLEHGSIGLLYRPDLDIEQIRQLEAIVGEYDDHLFSMPYTGEMESPITVAAWAYTMELDEVDEDAINQFIEEFRMGGAAPEAKTDCDHQDPEPFQPEGAEGAQGDADATPAPDETHASPHPTDSPTS